MPSSDYSSVEYQQVRTPNFTRGSSVQQHQRLTCPRCESTDTKFCYYNNYNLSQPRHFCKTCRRYWTHGGSLRDVPIGGGKRKHSCKRTTCKSRSSSSSSSSPSLSPTTSYSPISDEQTVYPNPITSSRTIPTSVSSSTFTVRSSDNVYHHLFNGYGGSFSSVLNPQPSPTLLTLNGYGFSSLDEMVTFETGKGVVWPLGFGENTHSGSVGLFGGGIGNTWQLGIDGGGGATGGAGNDSGDGDFLTWPDLGISAPQKSVK